MEGELRPTANIEEFLRAPVGRCLTSEHFVVWCPPPELCGTSFWDRVSESEIRTLVAIYDVARRRGMAPPIDTVMDGTGMTGVDPSAFEVLLTDVRRFRTELPALVRRQAIILPHGLLGATMAGFLVLTGAPYPYKTVESLEEGFSWFHLPGAVARAAQIGQLVQGLRGVPSLLASLRALLQRQPGRLTLASAAVELGVSTRSLQRHLADAGTSFRGELLASRVRAATTLVANSDHKLETVARMVGVASASHLSQIVRRATGATLGDHRR
jgi:AraC-like DNA-binding protein